MYSNINMSLHILYAIIVVIPPQHMTWSVVNKSMKRLSSARALRAVQGPGRSQSAHMSTRALPSLRSTSSLRTAAATTRQNATSSRVRSSMLQHAQRQHRHNMLVCSTSFTVSGKPLLANRFSALCRDATGTGPVCLLGTTFVARKRLPLSSPSSPLSRLAYFSFANVEITPQNYVLNLMYLCLTTLTSSLMPLPLSSTSCHAHHQLDFFSVSSGHVAALSAL